MRWAGSPRKAARLACDCKTPAWPCTPRSSVWSQRAATSRTRASDWWVLRLSARKSQGASGSVSMAWAICAAKSAAVRVGPSAGGEDLPGGDVEGGDQAEGAVADVLVLAALGATGAQRFRRRGAFERLDAGHLVGAGDVAAERLQHRRVGVGRAYRLHLRREGLRIGLLGLGIEPVAAAMRLQIGLHLRNARPSGPRCG